MKPANPASTKKSSRFRDLKVASPENWTYTFAVLRTHRPWSNDARLVSGSGDLIFRTVEVVSRSKSWTNDKTVHFGFLAIPRLAEVEKLVRETLIDCFVDRLQQANAI